MILGGLLFISWTSTGTYLDDVENGHRDGDTDGCDDEMVVLEEAVGDLESHWRRRSGPAALIPLGCIVNVYLYGLIYTYTILYAYEK